MKLINLVSVAAGALSPLAVATEVTAPVVTQSQVFDPFSLKGDDHVKLELEALYWKTYEQGLGYVIENKGSTTTVSHGHTKHGEFDWNWGGRGSIGFKFPSWDKWDLQLSYTYFHGTATEHETAPTGGALFPSFIAPQAGNVFATKAHFHGVVILNASEIELGRSCHVSRWLEIRPSIGVKGVAIHQHFRLRFEGGTVAPIGDEDLVFLGNLYWGVGPRFAVDSLWGLGGGFGLFLNGAGSLVAGRFFGHQKEHLDQADITRLNVRDHESAVVPIAELALGLQWDKMMYNNRFHLGLKVGFEMQYFFDQNRLLHFHNFSSPGLFTQDRGDLSFMGLTFGFQFDF
ncbi:MAG: hypothetical protein JSR58_05185 [Verrucomicrobia bacterium]|nr:hypothetical protein [Verrucomicrobiota bacterium]